MYNSNDHTSFKIVLKSCSNFKYYFQFCVVISVFYIIHFDDCKCEICFSFPSWTFWKSISINIFEPSHCKMKWKEKEMSHCSGELSKTIYKVFSKEFTTNQIRMPIIPRCRWLKPGGLRLGGQCELLNERSRLKFSKRNQHIFNSGTSQFGV